MIEVLIYGYLTSIHIYICGYLFFYFFVDKNAAIKNNLFELFFFGSFILCFIALFANFFISLNKSFNTILLLFPFVLYFFLFNKNFVKKVLLFSLPISLLFMLTISYDGTYRPDAGSYHLPYVSILNESKIIIGINNIHFRFGHTSIIQYFSSIYNNHIFGEKGITIPVGLIFCNFVGYCILEFLNSKNDKLYKVVLFLLFSFVIFRVNRYSDFGNDAPANLLFFYLILESLRHKDNLLKIKKTIYASTFIFLNKVTLLICFLLPVYFIFKKFELRNLLNKASIFCFIFIILYTGKNIMVSGCIIFPVEQTCIKNLYWYDNGSNRESNAVNARLENEAWTKGWVNQIGERKSYENYLDNYEWINTWTKSEGKKIIKKILPLSLFFLLLIVFFIVYEIRNKNKIRTNFKINNNYYACIIICLIGTLLWFFKFPLFRYGYGYFASFFSILIALLIIKFNFFHNPQRFKKFLINISIFLLLIILLKNGNRIYKGLNNETNVWPNIYGSGKNYKKKKHLPIKKNNKIFFYKSVNEECYYSSSPCTHFYTGEDFTLNDINLDNFHGYKIYYFNKKN